jgi:RNA polymerase sigma-70 factor (ECF subfamily)
MDPLMAFGKQSVLASDLLVEKARKGEAASQGKLVQLWYKRIYNFAFKFFADHDLAMEVSQKTFISMYRHINKLKEPSSFPAWIYAIVANHCRDELRRGKGERTTSIERDMSINSDNFPSACQITLRCPSNPETHAMQREMAEILQKALLQLPEEQRKVLIMKEYEGLKFREIAEGLGISENTVKSRLYAALDNMKKILQKQNINKESYGYEI